MIIHARHGYLVLWVAKAPELLAGDVLFQPETKTAEVYEVAAQTPGVVICFEPLPPDEVILGNSAAMRDVQHKLERVACTHVPVLIRGEAGSGKEVLARLIHRRYPGGMTPFHKVTPAGRDGWRKSASFVCERNETNSNGHHHHSVPGRPACVGSLFFEEIAELNFASQRKLAHLLRDDSFTGKGTIRTPSSLLRMICSTRHDIEREMRMENFREDLFYSINVVTLHLPPLRSRREDIPILAQYFWGCYEEKFGSDAPEPSLRLVEALQKYDWPGNIREFANVMKRYALLGSEGKIVDDLAELACRPVGRKPQAVRPVSLKNLARQEAQEVERKVILRTLRETRWNRKRAARALNISYRSLLYRIKEAGLPPKRVLVKRERQN